MQNQGTSSQPFGFTGERRDQESELLDLRARAYDPQTGRFMQRDPLAGLVFASQALNRYAYAQNNPVTRLDPSGLSPVDADNQYEDDCFKRSPGPVPAYSVTLLCTNMPLTGEAPALVEGPGGPMLVPGLFVATPPGGGRGRSPALDRLVEMMNRRSNTVARWAEGEAKAFLDAVKANASTLTQGSERGSLQHDIVLDPERANRQTLFHEWLHRYFNERNGGELAAGVEQKIEQFLEQHTGLFGER